MHSARQCFYVSIAASALIGVAHAARGDDVPAPYEPNKTYAPDVDPDDLSPAITNPLFPAPVGARWLYVAETDEGIEEDVVEVRPGTRNVWGTRVREVHDAVFLNGELIEDTLDWYAQDDDGNVWYLGEDTVELEDGEVVCHCGAWESGVDGALPGVAMLADPEVGDVYRQEYYEDVAEDWAKVVSLDETVTVPAGTFTGCVKTRDRSALDPSVHEYKYYCPGVGTVLVEEAGGVRVELIEACGQPAMPACVD